MTIGKQLEEFNVQKMREGRRRTMVRSGEFQPAQLIGMSYSSTDLPLPVIFSPSFSYCLIFFASTCIFAQSRPTQERMHTTQILSTVNNVTAREQSE